MTTYLGPWHWNAADGCYAAPPGCRALVDLSPNHAPGILGLFAGPRPTPDYAPVADPVAVAWAALTGRAAPDGLGGPRPLVPTTAGRLELHLGPTRRRERFRWGRHPHTNRLRDQLRGQFAARWEAGAFGLARRCLDFEREKYRLTGADWRELVPPRLLPHVPGPLPHATTITESFDKADADTLGPDLTWTELVGDIDVVSNTARTTGTAQAEARADTDLSSADHYAQAVVLNSTGTNGHAGLMCRKDSSATRTFYKQFASFNNDQTFVQKVIATVPTILGTSPSKTYNSATTYTLKLTCNGSTLTSRSDGVDVDTFTDTAITTGTRCGIAGRDQAGSGSYSQWDNFEAADLGGGGGSVLPVFMHHYREMGICG